MKLSEKPVGGNDPNQKGGSQKKAQAIGFRILKTTGRQTANSGEVV
jgi:hypothetical protein